MTENQLANKPQNPLQLLLAAAQDADTDKLEKLMDLQERWERNEAEKALCAALAEFQANCPTITKERSAHQSKYADLADIVRVIRGPLASAGLSYQFDTQEEGEKLECLCTISHKSGAKRTTRFMCPVDPNARAMNAAQKQASANTYAKRYALCNALGIVCADEDDDGHAAGADVEFIAQDEADDLREICSAIKVEQKKVCEWQGISELEQLPKSKLKEVRAMLDKKAKANKAGGAI